MLKQLFNSKESKVFALLSFLLFATMLAFQIINGRFWLHDFEVMYSAADSFLNGKPVYGVPFGLGTGFYKYSPFTLLFFMPYTVIAYKVACVLHFIITCICAILVVPLLHQIVRKHLFNYPKIFHLTLFTTLGAVIVHIIRDLHLGNINLIIVFLLVLALKFLIENKTIQFAILLAIVIFTKPYFIVLALPLLLHKKFNAFGYVALFGAVFLLFSLVFLGFSAGVDLYWQWFEAMLNHNSYLTSNATIFYLLNYYAGFQIGPEHAFTLLGVLVLISSAFFWLFIKRKESNDKLGAYKNQALIFQLVILLALIPNVFITDTEHFIFSLPLISILIIYFSPKKRLFWVPFLVVLFLMYGGNSTDFLGNSLNKNYHELGLLGIGNLLLVIVAIIVFVVHFRKRHREMRTSD